MSRPPKPTALKLVTGNPGKRALSKQEPDPDYLRDLTPPAWLPASAQEVWKEVAPTLARAKLLTEVDVQSLAMGCVAMAQYRRASRIDDDQLVKAKMVKDDEGRPVATGEHVNPWTMVQSMSFKQAMAVFQQFGMTPAARARISINPQGTLFPGSGADGGDEASGYFR